MIYLAIDPPLAELARAHAPGLAPAMFNGVALPASRICELGWIYQNGRNQALFDGLWAHVHRANEVFKFDIATLGGLQYTVYQPTGHYDWHQDWGTDEPFAIRKLSVSLGVSPLEDYDGGAFEYHAAGAPQSRRLKPGELIVFPSFLPHRVTPVTRGTRVSLVAWATGVRLI